MGPAVIISPSELPAEVVGTSYAATLESDVVGELNWEVVSGDLPPGLFLGSDTGTISGIAQAAGMFEFVVGVEERSLITRNGEALLTITIIERLTLDANLEPARAEQSYSRALSALGGVSPYTFDVIGLPAGLTFNESTGEVSGTPLTANDLTLQVFVTDAGEPQQSASVLTSLHVKPVLISITTESLEDGLVGAAYLEQLRAMNGTPPYHWAVVDGLLPNSLRLSLDFGAISGTPEVTETAVFTIEVTDSSDPVERSSAEFRITIQP
jgi:Putative Ig domain